MGMLVYKFCYRCGVQESKATLRQGEKHVCKPENIDKWDKLNIEEKQAVANKEKNI